MIRKDETTSLTKPLLIDTKIPEILQLIRNYQKRKYLKLYSWVDFLVKRFMFTIR